MIVSSFFEGNVRLKALLLKNSEISRQITDMLTASKSIENITLNEITGSMLIEYSPSKIPLFKIKKAMPYFEKIKEIYEIYGEETVPEILSIIKEMDNFFKQ